MADQDDNDSVFSFALNPAKAMGGDIINYKTKEGKKLWDTATASLSDEGFGRVTHLVLVVSVTSFGAKAVVGVWGGRFF